MATVKVNLSPLQRQRFEKARQNLTDFSAKLSLENLEGNDSLYVGKVMARRIEKAQGEGKGVILKITSNEMKKNKGGQGMGGQHFMVDGVKYVNAKAPIVIPDKFKLKKEGKGVAAVGAVIGTAAGVLNAIGAMDPVKDLVRSFGKELEYLIMNPAASKWKNIYAERLPRLAERWRNLANDIKFLEGLKGKAMKIRRIERKRADIVSLAQRLIEQAPIFKALAEQRDEVLQKREEERARQRILKLENELESLKGNGLQIEGPKGKGLQIEGKGGCLLVEVDGVMKCFKTRAGADRAIKKAEKKGKGEFYPTALQRAIQKTKEKKEKKNLK
jgi:hypothetical protein